MSANPFDDDYAPPPGETNLYHRQVTDSLQSTLASTNRSIQALLESERVGAETGEDLIRQREKLEATNRRLDEMDTTMTQTQRNLNSIKSIFGGVKNYFSKAPRDPQATEAADSAHTQRLQSTVDRVRSTDASGFYENSNSSQQNAQRPSARIPELRAHSAWNAMDEEIDGNLDLMSQNMRRIRELGLALGDEIEEQNDLLDGISEKTGKTGDEIRRQDAQIRDIMGLNKKKKGSGVSIPSMPSGTQVAARAAVSSANPFEDL